MVDYSSLENYRTERYRGFESLSLRKIQKGNPKIPFFLLVLPEASHLFLIQLFHNLHILAVP